jgi:hypothetical protein
MNIEELAKQNDRWQMVALKICGDPDFAKDMVQNMYLACFDYESVNSSFVYKTLMNLFLADKRIEKPISIDQYHLIFEDKRSTFEPTDEEQLLFDRFEQLYWTDQDLVKESYEMSFREIQKKFPMVNYMYAYRRVLSSLKYVLQDRIEEFDNKRLKYKKK